MPYVHEYCKYTLLVLNRVLYIDYIALAIVPSWGDGEGTQYRIVGRYVRSTVHVPSDTLGTWKWSPTPDRYLCIRAPQGPGCGPPPPECFPL